MTSIETLVYETLLKATKAFYLADFDDSALEFRNAIIVTTNQVVPKLSITAKLFYFSDDLTDTERDLLRNIPKGDMDSHLLFLLEKLGEHLGGVDDLVSDLHTLQANDRLILDLHFVWE